MRKGCVLNMTKEDILKGIEACSEFICDECPYQKFDSKDYPIRCMHFLITDINEMLKGGE